MRHPAAVAAALLVGMLLTACTADSSGLMTTETDVRRAQAAWQDPWLAPADPAVPTSGYGSDGHVVRSAGARTYLTAAAPVPAALTEVESALDHGWRLVGATCRDGQVTAQVARGSSLDDAVLAEVVATEDRTGTEVTVSGQVPHHADGSWPPLDASPPDLDETCLAGGSAEAPLVSLPGPPTSGTGEAGPEDSEGWERDHYTDDEAALLADLAADPWVAETVPDAAERLAPRDDLGTGDRSRFGVLAEGELPAGSRDPRQAVSAVVATMPGWEPTWAACSPGRHGVVDVRLRLLTDHGVATARLLDDAHDAVTWELRTPIAEGPDPAWVSGPPALVDSSCLSDAEIPAGLTVEGLPVALPSDLQPVP